MLCFKVYVSAVKCIIVKHDIIVSSDATIFRPLPICPHPKLSDTKKKRYDFSRRFTEITNE